MPHAIKDQMQVITQALDGFFSVAGRGDWVGLTGENQGGDIGTNRLAKFRGDLSARPVVANGQEIDRAVAENAVGAQAGGFGG